MITHHEEGRPRLGDRAALERALAARDYLSGADLRGLGAGGADLRGVSFAGARLAGANLSGLNLAGADFTGADLRRARLDWTDLTGARLVGARGEFAVFGCAILDGADFERADLKRVNLVGARARGARFAGADLYYARAAGADFRGADFAKANLGRAIFRASDLRGATLDAADAAVGQPNLDRARVGPVSDDERAPGGETTSATALGETPDRVGPAHAPPNASAPGRKGMILQPFVFDCGPLEVNHYVFAEEATGRAALVDAGVFDPSVAEFVRGRALRLETILLTHHHHDHIDAAPDYEREFGAEAFSPAPTPKAPAARPAVEGTPLEVAGFRVEVFKTSGHTPEGVSYWLPEAGVCFVGDAIFAGAVGGTPRDDLHEEQLTHLRRAILTLPSETELHSGHGPMTTVAIESKGNPFLWPGFTRLP